MNHYLFEKARKYRKPAINKGPISGRISLTKMNEDAQMNVARIASAIAMVLVLDSLKGLSI